VRAEVAPVSRLAGAWRRLAPERRAAALLSAGLFASMFLHWYSKTDTLVVHGAAKATETSLSAFQAFSFVEAAVLLVSAGVLTMLFARAEGGRFQVPGGDGLIVMIAGGWAALLIFYRMLDKPGLHGNARVTATVGVEWGIFVALLLALGLLAAGRRIRAHERPEPPLLRRRGARERPRRAPQGEAARFAPSAAAHAPGPDQWTAATAATAGAQPPPLAQEPTPSLAQEPPTVIASARAPRAPAASVTGRRRPRYPPAPAGTRGEQLSFEDPPAGES